MATPSDEGNDLALVPAKTPVAPASGGCTPPRGSPVVYGPVGRGSCDVNPFWSQSTKEEVILQATRPSSLPEPIPTEAEVQISPPREGLDWDLALTSIVEENLRLRKEIMEIKGMVVVKHTSMGLLLCLLKERLSMEGTNRELMEG
ncbi:unnamed protein product [Effrenium voratum]|nr:unnamed protein product [Effrenium voratum]